MNMQPDPKIVLKFTQVALAAMSARALVWVTMLIAASLFGFAAYTSDPVRAGIAVIFTLLVYWRATWHEKVTKPDGESNG